MTKLQAIRSFVTAVLNEPTVIAKDRFHNNNFAMDVGNNCPRIKLPVSLNMKPDKMDMDFRKDFIKRFPPARGFSHITLSLLHECGHWATRSVVNIIVYDKMRDSAKNMEQYIAIPYERLATDWAICWLCCPANRQIAKEFERNYFGH